MPNHFHFLIRQIEPFGSTRFFRGVCGGYVRAVNNAYNKSGHLFEGKFKMKPVESDEYLLHLSRYIHLNPVRASLVSNPDDWEFGSCRSFYGFESHFPLNSEYVLSQTGGVPGYTNFVQTYVPEDKKRIERLLF
jgi:hypothetical protein